MYLVDTKETLEAGRFGQQLPGDWGELALHLPLIDATLFHNNHKYINAHSHTPCSGEFSNLLACVYLDP